MSKRANYTMVNEDDPGWMRFWEMYPLRVSKKDARKAWSELRPAPELVDRMCAALAWQAPMWETQGYGTPYPASWLRAERWTDERRQTDRRQQPDEQGHFPPCKSRHECIQRCIDEDKKARHAS